MARIHKVFPDEFPESWASDWGEDEYGIFMGFTYKGIRQDFRWIEPGTFLMGSPENEPEREDDEIQHEVTISKGFWLADTTVTQALWSVVMDSNPSSFKSANCSVENISWDDANGFINKMNNIKAELRLCLPSEAQWEYACRAGTTTPFYFGKQVSLEIVNYDGNHPYNNGRKEKHREHALKVGSFSCNNWGLYDMHGNVYEWCQDFYAGYPAQPIVDPQGSQSGTRRVLRGGSWVASGRRCRSAYRSRHVPTLRYEDLGFRLARCL